MPKKSAALSIVKNLQDAGFIAYFAGGWVRDFLIGCPSDDIDIVTSALPQQVMGLFPKTVPVGISFGIVIVVQEGIPFEVATFRKDKEYVDGRRPTSIEPATPQEDAERRDFTINGMFYDPLKEELFDFVQGQLDLKNGIIRAIGDPHARFLEDRLRMMRAVRYCTRFNFPIEHKTMAAILTHASSLLPAVAHERVWQEFKKMAQFAHFDRGLVLLHRLDLLPTIFPKLKNVPLEEIEKRLRFIEYFPPNTPTIAQLLELFPRLSLEEQLSLCDYLKLPNQDKAFVQELHRATSLLNMQSSWLKNLEPIEWAQFYASPSTELCLGIIGVHQENKTAFLAEHKARIQTLERAISRLRNKTPVVSAAHLLREGIKPGVQLGELLAEAERISINQALEDPCAIIAQLKQLSLWR